MALVAPRRVAQGMLLFVIAGYLATTVPGVRGDIGFSWWMDGILQNAAYGAAAALCALRAKHTSEDRLAWWMVATGLLMLALSHGYTVWAVRHDPPPTLTADHLLRWGFYVCAFIAVYLMMRARVDRFSMGFVLDGLVVALGAATLVAAVLLPWLAPVSRGDPLRSAITVIYPLSDLILLALISCAVSFFGWRPPPSFWWLVAGLMIFGLADYGFVIQSARGAYRPGGPVEAAWMMGVSVLALAPGRVHTPRQNPAAATWLPLAAPVVAATAATSVLVIDRFTDINVIATFLALFTIMAALGRLAVAFLDARRAGEHAVAARTDDLTQLLNRRGLYERAAAALDRPRLPDGAHSDALLLLDLDHFKDINDSLGHTTGDELLRVVAGRLATSIGPRGILARLGGDEFAVLLPGSDADEATRTAAQLITALAAPMQLAGLHVQTGASIGIALRPGHCEDWGTMLRYADIAMYEAKRRQSGFTVYGSGMREKLTSRAGLQLLSQLRRAIEGRELTVHYQPQVRLIDGAITGVEALVRWDHPDRGMLYPDQFLPLARHNHLMQTMTELVIDIALEDSAAWRARGHDIPVAINLSPSAFAETDLPLRIDAALHWHRTDTRHFAVEITEDFLIANLDRASAVLNRLRDRGIRIAIDDFGSGYSSLHYLRELPIDEVKLDQSFTAGITTDPTSAAIVRSVIELSRTIGLTTVAEGVETGADVAALDRYGCDVVQGHYYSPALSVGDLMRWIDARTGTAAPSTAAGSGG